MRRTRSPKPGSPAWIAEHRTAIFSTDAAACANLSRFSDAFSVYLEKLGLSAPKLTTEAMEFGLILQDPIARAWAKRDNQKVIPAGQWTYWRGDLPFPMATHLDFLLPNGEIVEVKNASHFAGSDFGEEHTDQVPIDYALQVHHQMAVLDAPRAHIVALIGGNKLRHYLIERDPETEANLLTIEQAAWEGVLSKTPPEIDGSDGATEFLRISQPSDDGVVIEADETLQELAALHVNAAEAEKAAIAQKKELTNKIKGILDTVSEANGGGFKITYRQNKPSEVVEWAAVAEEMRNYALSLGGLIGQWNEAVAENTEIKKGARPLLVTYKEGATA